MIGATGPQMMELTGEIADGAVLNYCVPPEYNIEALEQLERGAAHAGRKLEDIDRPQLVGVSVHEDRKEALDGPRAAHPVPGAAAAYCQGQRCQARSGAADSVDLGLRQRPRNRCGPP